MFRFVFSCFPPWVLRFLFYFEMMFLMCPWLYFLSLCSTCVHSTCPPLCVYKSLCFPLSVCLRSLAHRVPLNIVFTEHRVHWTSCSLNIVFPWTSCFPEHRVSAEHRVPWTSCSLSRSCRPVTFVFSCFYCFSVLGLCFFKPLHLTYPTSNTTPTILRFILTSGW